MNFFLLSCLTICVGLANGLPMPDMNEMVANINFDSFEDDIGLDDSLAEAMELGNGNSAFLSESEVMNAAGGRQPRFGTSLSSIAASAPASGASLSFTNLASLLSGLLSSSSG